MQKKGGRGYLQGIAQIGHVCGVTHFAKQHKDSEYLMSVFFCFILQSDIKTLNYSLHMETKQLFEKDFYLMK